jgi:hypothetical protein
MSKDESFVTVFVSAFVCFLCHWYRFLGEGKGMVENEMFQVVV